MFNSGVEGLIVQEWAIRRGIKSAVCGLRGCWKVGAVYNVSILTCSYTFKSTPRLTFRKCASYIWDGHTFFLLLCTKLWESFGLLNDDLPFGAILTCSGHLTICIRLMSFLISTSHRDLGLPAGLPVRGFHGRAYRYPPNIPFYVFFQQIYVLNFLNMLHTLRFFASKCRLFYNATFFGFCIIRILHTGCAKI
jgi:hypothetical protein